MSSFEVVKANLESALDEYIKHFLNPEGPSSEVLVGSLMLTVAGKVYEAYEQDKKVDVKGLKWFHPGLGVWQELESDEEK